MRLARWIENGVYCAEMGKDFAPDIGLLNVFAMKQGRTFSALSRILRLNRLSNVQDFKALKIEGADSEIYPLTCTITI